MSGHVMLGSTAIAPAISALLYCVSIPAAAAIGAYGSYQFSRLPFFFAGESERHSCGAGCTTALIGGIGFGIAWSLLLYENAATPNFGMLFTGLKGAAGLSLAAYWYSEKAPLKNTAIAGFFTTLAACEIGLI